MQLFPAKRDSQAFPPGYYLLLIINHTHHDEGINYTQTKLV